MRRPVIIEAAINGATSKTVNSHVPVTEDEIVADGDQTPLEPGCPAK